MLALIIWGSSSRENTMGQGQFNCPRCQQVTPFAHKKIDRYFTLYFIPLFSTATLAQFVECGYCRGKFDPKILQAQAPQQGWPQQGG